MTKPLEGIAREPHIYWGFINEAASSALYHYRSAAVQVHTRLAHGNMPALVACRQVEG